jgi:hypothetical protein
VAVLLQRDRLRWSIADPGVQLRLRQRDVVRTKGRETDFAWMKNEE